jgi:transposase
VRYPGPDDHGSSRGKKRIKTDKRDAALIARCLAHHDYNEVHVPTEKDEQIKEFIRMRDDHKLTLKKVKQQILSFCLRHGIQYDGTKSHWTQTHINWLRSLKLDGVDQETLDEYLLSYDYLTKKLERIDNRIKELAEDKDYKENVHKLECFLGIKTITALSVIVETGDFKRFASVPQYAAYLGLVPGEDSSGGDQNRLPITKAGNRHLRMLLVEAAQCYGRGQIGFKSKALAARQLGNPSAAVEYADKANERMRRKYYRMTLKNGKKANVAKTAVARELACFLWGMMTENYA